MVEEHDDCCGCSWKTMQARPTHITAARYVNRRPNLTLPDEPSLLDRLPLGLIVVGRPCEFHQPASFGNRETTGPAMTDILALLGRRACRDAPFKNSFSSASLPTSRSSAAIRASYSASMSAAAVSLSSAPASCLAIQMRIRLRLMSCCLARP